MCSIDKGGALGTGLSPKLTWRMTQTQALRRCPCEGQHIGSAPCAVLFPSLWCFSWLSNLSVVEQPCPAWLCLSPFQDRVGRMKQVAWGCRAPCSASRVLCVLLYLSFLPLCLSLGLPYVFSLPSGPLFYWLFSAFFCWFSPAPKW